MIHTGEEHGHTCTPALVANLALDFPQITFITPTPACLDSCTR